MRWLSRVRAFWQDVLNFPWKNTALTLRERFREDRLPLSASSLTFTTTIALVPFLTLALAVFTAFPMFAKFQDVLQRWLVESLIPDNIARQVLGYLTQFAGKASRLGWAGLTALFFTALSLVFTIDRTLNSIWRVRRPRRWGQRLLVYWAAITLGPMLLGASLTMSSYLITASRGMVGGVPGGVRLLLDAVEFLMVAGAMTATYHYVPNTQVKWRHAWVGGIFAAFGIELAKKGLTLYLGMVPAYSAVYGAFATVPILLIWIYILWLIVLFGAVVTAYLPSLLSGAGRRMLGVGWRFELALEALHLLAQARHGHERGMTLAQLAKALDIDVVRLEPIVEQLNALDWVGRLQEVATGASERHVLLIELDQTPVQPLLERLLLRPSDVTAGLRARCGLDGVRVSEVLSASASPTRGARDADDSRMTVA